MKLPRDEEAEKFLIGAVLVDPGKLFLVNQIVSAKEFYSPRHQRIFKAINSLSEAGRPIDLVTVLDEANKSRSGERVQASYLAGILDIIPSPEMAEHYARIVKEKAMKRELYYLCSEGAKAALNETLAAVEAIADIEKHLDDMERGLISMADPSISELVKERYDQFLDEEGKEPNWVRTGFIDLDNLIGGLIPGEHVIVGARPSMGKSSYGLDLCRNTAKQGKRALFFTMEQSRARVVDRLICMESMASLTRFIRRKLPEAEKERICRNIMGIAAQNIGIIDGSWSGIDIRAKVLQEKKTHGLDLVVVDFLTLMKPCIEGSMHEMVGDNAKRNELTAIEANIPVVTLAQLSRKVEDRQNKRPTLRDLRESGNIEEYCDKVMFLYRDDYYNAGSKEKGIVEVIVAKNRDGPTGTVKLKWIEHAVTFRNLGRRPDNA